MTLEKIGAMLFGAAVASLLAMAGHTIVDLSRGSGRGWQALAFAQAVVLTVLGVWMAWKGLTS